MTPSRNRFVSKSRESAVTEVDARRAWLTLIATAKDHTARELAGQAIDKFEAAHLVNLVVRMKAPFPLRSASACNAAEAFLTVARGYVVAGRDRLEVAAFLNAGALCLDALLIAHGHELAALSRRRIGEVD